ncbi:low molecular weight protein-tyrosine-phosphatase [Novispirillum sp. DQ9]|uniref:low molecular weight protein-tyrosine-phosphatase n=1 Tax=Novispirillum sp. DQ9 TaxID=3398612 RepID=UPI003C7984CD
MGNPSEATIGVLFVCTGNICRSPTAEGQFRAAVAAAGLAHRFTIDSAATHDYHVGKPPDSRTVKAAARRGLDLAPLRARQVAVDDFGDFDFIVAMDRGHLEILSAMAPPGGERRLSLFLDHAPQCGLRDVPDPYYGGPDGFETVLDLIAAGCDGLLAHIRKTAALAP